MPKKCKGKIEEKELSSDDMVRLNEYLRTKAGLIDGWNGRSTFSHDELLSWMKGIPPRGLTMIKFEPDSSEEFKVNVFLDFISGMEGDVLEALRAVRHCR